MKNIDPKKGFLLFFGAMIISGSIGVFVQKINLPAINIVFFRCLIGAIFLGLYVLLFKRNNFKKSLREIKYIIICGVFLVLNWVFLFSSFKHTSVSVSISIYYLAPIFIMLYGMLRMREEITKVKIISILIAFFGAILASGINPFLEINPNILGVIFAFLAALFYAALVVIAKNIKEADPAHIAFIQTFVGILLLLFFINYKIDALNELRYELIIIIGVVHTAVMYILFFTGIRYSTMGTIAILGFIDPLVAVLLDNIIFETSLSYYQWVGIIFIMFAVVMKLYSDGAISFVSYLRKETKA